MEDFLSAFRTEVFRPIVTLILPGGLAISSWSVMLLQRHPLLLQLTAANHVEAAVLLVTASLFCGLVIDDLGARLEAKVLDLRVEKELPGHLKNWTAYLCLTFPSEPIGRGYIRDLVLRLKFELGAPIGCVIAALGLPFVRMPLFAQAILIVLSLLLAAYLGLLEGPETHRVLSRARAALIESRCADDIARSTSEPARSARPGRH